MHSFKLFVTLCILVIWAQNIETRTAQELSPDNKFTLSTAIVLAKNDKYLISFKDVWQKVKTSVVIAWNHVKVVANNAKAKMNVWMTNVKKRAEEINKVFEEKVKDLRQNIHDVINKVFGNGEMVKECIKQEKNAIETFLSDIIQRMGSCIRRNIGNHSILRTGQEPIELNETQFMEQLEKKLQLCEKDPKDFETCLNKVREDTVGDIQNVETNLYNIQTESRMVVDNLLDAIVACSIDGLIEASSIAATEALKITKCVLNGSQNKPETPKQIV
ncbi:hypothetical protein K1T71_005475 [Dendrolimus kikuchii]|uniref:Uncharacterized protein n=1 Tax=Dendrolimus kikuchii TaxID=765133 RepID=A0ACC1D4I7_9NEOP|nr:hypothetical protein K1T71_005475 [Dendrolimus kikuchii]